MKKNSFILNKYTLSLLILLLCLAADIILHKGMSRVLIPKSFTDNRSPQYLKLCDNPLIISKKKWIKAVNTVQKMDQIAADAAGLEMDVYFDTVKNLLQVYHDSTETTRPFIEDILNVYATRKLTASIWLDFKNLSIANEKKSGAYISFLRQRYQLQNKVIVESSSPQYLHSFCDSGFFTSYYTPFFNPYLHTEKEIVQAIDTIALNLKMYPASALSGYYFQYPLLKKFFPNYPILIWAENDRYSFVSNIFKRTLDNDQQVKIVLYH
ncbi:hypothetical protein [Ferruginibacter sp.]|uniref:hypothetical protein n=1 Tax=Ferruginibacter sp. TaxID=1940288 RepID=UPI0019BAFB20|nr:hypothetical protein [Ferruginibacter sp.]MBC7629794.1 hypothetical protein [Ferruginibacter sp.]